IIGSSRILFNIQLNEWEQASGERPIQLALEGTSPMSIMEDLADDPDFTGTLLVGVSPGLFFSGFEFRKPALEKYHRESPSSWIGQRISMLIEPYFAFLHLDFALFTILEREQHEDWLPEREGVLKFRDVRKLADMDRDRNTRMWSKVENDAEYQALSKTIWAQRFKPISERSEEEIQGRLAGRAAQIDRAVAAVEKLHARGVEVIFIRMPSQGYYAELSEPQYNPRAETWDVLIERSGALGIHWKDHEEMQGYTLPEWSHMRGADARELTPKLYRLIERERAGRNGTPND
ncbi:MAG: hypothetical protein MJA83_17200, partial [Gammaproteobacteria bacterium]|nr:hypothetical protein [Gammaproteobacteria bacterium]